MNGGGSNVGARVTTRVAVGGADVRRSSAKSTGVGGVGTGGISRVGIGGASFHGVGGSSTGDPLGGTTRFSGTWGGIGGATRGTSGVGGDASPKAIDVAVGDAAACILRNDGRVVCWRFAPEPAWSEVPGVENARSVSVGGPGLIRENQVACAVIGDGTVRCWDYDSFEQTDSNRQLAVPTIIEGISSAVEVSVGKEHSCVLLADKTVNCWGANLSGQLGAGQSNTALQNSSVPVEVVGLKGATTISAGSDLTCATLEDKTVRCWGYLALAGNYDVYSTATDLELVGVVNISAGVGHACALFLDGTARCWGDVTYGTGYGRGYSPTGPTNAVIEPGSRPAVRVSAGSLHDCALGFDGSITCWGTPEHLGLGGDENEAGFFHYRTGPGPVVGITNAVAIDAGNDLTCAVLADGSVWCWGLDWSNGATRGLPQRVQGL